MSNTFTDITIPASSFVQGKGYAFPYIGTANANGTATNALGGGLNGAITGLAVGSTLPATIQGYPNTGATNVKMMTHVIGNSTISGGWLVWLYLAGTLDLTATGDKFTAAAGITFPLLRTNAFGASQNVVCRPLLHVTTALTTTAAVVTMKNAGATTGYKNQANATVVGTRSLTFPSATTAINTALTPFLEDTDSGVTAIQSINVGTAAATGACNVYLVEYIAPMNTYVLAKTMVHDSISRGLNLGPIASNPAVATGGTVTSYLTYLMADSSLRIPYNLLIGAQDA